MVVYDDTSHEPVRIFDSGVTIRDPESFGEFQLSYRTGDIVSPRVDVDGAAVARAGRLLPRDPDRDGATRRARSSGSTSSASIEAAERSLRSGGVRTPVEPIGAPLRT